MKPLIPVPTEDQMNPHGLIAGPVWPNHCGHEEHEYVCSFQLNNLESGHLVSKRYDLYVIADSHHGNAICLRDGPEPQDYASPGGLIRFCASAFQPDGFKLPSYYRGAMILLEFGKCHWSPQL